MPPGVILRPEHPGTWTTTDRILAVADVIAENARCPDCGQPKSEAWNPDSEGWYERYQADCNGCAELHRGAADERTPRAERKRWVQDARPAEVELRPWQPQRDGAAVSGPAVAQPATGRDRPVS